MRLGKTYPLFAEPSARISGSQEKMPNLAAIESDAFPFEFVSEIAEAESWRKEVHRPTYHVHKWWAQRLGSVFRAIILGAVSQAETNIRELFYQPVRLGNIVVFDPFMGSGTTLGETIKAGGRAIGRDINPVAHFLVRNALSLPSEQELRLTFNKLRQNAAPLIEQYYQARVGLEVVPVLYYFWVKQVPCISCGSLVDLFSTRIFAKNAYSSNKPLSQSTCPTCGSIHACRVDSHRETCANCEMVFDPQQGNVDHDRVTCPNCQSQFRVIDAVARLDGPPPHRLYAKLVLERGCQKRYLAIDDFDRKLYQKAATDLAASGIVYPTTEIAPGYNTNQVLRYNYHRWHQMFNARQLLCLGHLAKKIAEIEDKVHRDVFCCLFSGVLEFNNMFASYKGEGTGAVRHMFSHHILKPERTPLEANPWGTARSSGAFSTLFQSRILRAAEYAYKPYEIRVGSSGEAVKVYGISKPMTGEIASSYAEFEEKPLYLSCGPSQNTDIPSNSVDLVVTDPPFFDNVHYSELADFFHAWQKLVRDEDLPNSTRSPAEVQNGDVGTFTKALASVWKECFRVLRDEGLLVFTYHHSRQEGWSSLLQSLKDANFLITAVHPVKSEMSVATPKAQSKQPIDIDVIIACRKAAIKNFASLVSDDPFNESLTAARAQVHRFNSAGKLLGKGDVRVVLMAQMLKRFSQNEAYGQDFQQAVSGSESAVDDLFATQLRV